MGRFASDRVIYGAFGLVSVLWQVFAEAPQDLHPDLLVQEDCLEDGATNHVKLLQKRSAKETTSKTDEDLTKPEKPCLCIFDTDRTLTAIQDHEYDPPFRKLWFPKTGAEKVDPKCPGTADQPLSKDSAYPMDFSGPNLTMRISEMSARFEDTFCGKRCYRGILSVGTIGGQKFEKFKAKGYFKMVNTLEFILQKGPEEYALPCSHKSKWTPLGKECSINALDTHDIPPENLKPFIINIGAACEKKDPSLGKFSGTCKVDYVQNITAYYKAVENVTIADEDVYFYDDACVNVEGFKGSKYRARQISCARRQCWQEPKNGAFKVDNNLGVCGATVDEVNSLLTGPKHYMCTVDDAGKCEI